jgi:hypothetical protein
MSAVLGSGGHLASYALELMERRLVSRKRDLDDMYNSETLGQVTNSNGQPTYLPSSCYGIT